MEQQKSNGKKRWTAFLLSFLAAVMIFSLAVGGVMMWGGTFSNLAASSEESPVSEGYQPDPGQSLMVLAIGCRERGDPAKAFALLYLNAADHSLSVCALPPETLATVNIRTDTLAGFYDYGGAQMAEEAVQNAYNVYINRYVRVSMEAFCTFFDLLGGVEMALPYDMANRAQREGSLPAQEEGQNQLLDGNRAYELFGTPGAGELDQVHLQTGILGAFFKQHITPRTVQASETLFNAVINLVDTDITRYDYTCRVEMLEELARSSGPVKEIYVQGEFTADGFLPAKGTLGDMEETAS